MNNKDLAYPGSAKDTSAASASPAARYRKALEEIARGLTPPEAHGHYLAHRHAVKLAREALRE